MALTVDNGQISIESFYDQWDKMRFKLNMDNQVCAKRSDGSQKCIPKGDSVLFLETKDGNIIPYE